MKTALSLLGGLTIALLAFAFSTTGTARYTPSTVLAAGAPTAPPAACSFPTHPAATPQETAWELFVAANCTASNGKLVWENWIEQDSLYPLSGKGGLSARQAGVRRLHGSPLARAEALRRHLPAVELVPNSQCNPMNGPPPNVVSGATVCEEVHINPAAASFIRSHGYQVRAGQMKAAKLHADIQFPYAGIEVKVDWIPASDFTTPFSCSNPPAGLHVEEIDGACYAMAGIHIESKLLKDWLWATFEPQSMLTNPLRCITFGPCNDPWGSKPASSSGGAAGFTQQTSELANLMQAAKLAPAFSNYRLDGAQTQFTINGEPTYLGNSIIEGENVGMTYNTASCITCHSVSGIKADGTDGIANLANQVGPEYQQPPGFIARDFVWSLGLACPDPNGGLRTCKK
jgi:hypothetical protein